MKSLTLLLFGVFVLGAPVVAGTRRELGVARRNSHRSLERDCDSFLFEGGEINKKSVVTPATRDLFSFRVSRSRPR